MTKDKGEKKGKETMRITEDGRVLRKGRLGQWVPEEEFDQWREKIRTSTQRIADDNLQIYDPDKPFTGSFGRPVTEEEHTQWRRKLSQSHQGHPYYPTEETAERIEQRRESARNHYGTEEWHREVLELFDSGKTVKEILGEMHKNPRFARLRRQTVTIYIKGERGSARQPRK